MDTTAEVIRSVGPGQTLLSITLEEKQKKEQKKKKKTLAGDVSAPPAARSYLHPQLPVNRRQLGGAAGRFNQRRPSAALRDEAAGRRTGGLIERSVWKPLPLSGHSGSDKQEV